MSIILSKMSTAEYINAIELFWENQKLAVPNIPLLRKVIEHVQNHPEEYNQNIYWSNSECGSTGCIAGWAIAFDEGIGSDCYPNNGESFDLAGARSLGLTRYEAYSLFAAYNSWQDVMKVAREIAARAGEEL